MLIVSVSLPDGFMQFQTLWKNRRDGIYTVYEKIPQPREESLKNRAGVAQFWVRKAPLNSKNLCYFPQII